MNIKIIPALTNLRLRTLQRGRRLFIARSVILRRWYDKEKINFNIGFNNTYRGWVFCVDISLRNASGGIQTERGYIESDRKYPSKFNRFSAEITGRFFDFHFCQGFGRAESNGVRPRGEYTRQRPIQRESSRVTPG